MNIDSETIGRVFDESWTHRIAFIVIAVIAVLFILFIFSMKKQEWKEKKSRRRLEHDRIQKEEEIRKQEEERDPYEAAREMFRMDDRDR